MFGRKSLLYLISNFIASGLSFVGLFFMTNYLGAETYGTISWTLALLAAFNSISDLGFYSAHIKRVSEGKDIDDCVSTYVTIQIILICVMVALTAVSLLIWIHILGGSPSGIMVRLVILFVLYYILFDLSNIATVTFNARMETAKAQILTLINPLIRIPLVIFVSINRMAATDLAFAYVITAVFVFVIALLLLHREKISWTRPSLIKSYFSFALPLSSITIVSALSMNLDKLMIGFFGTATQVAYYTSSQTLLSMFIIIGSSVSALAFPSFSYMHEYGNIKGIRTTTRQAERYLSMIGMPIMIPFVLFPSEIAYVLFGVDFLAAGEPMRFLAVSMLLTLLNSVYNAQILSTNHPIIAAKIILLSFSVNTALLLILIPTSVFGIPMMGLAHTGAAIANMMGIVVIFIMTRIVVWRLTGTKSNPRLFLHIIAAINSAILLIILTELIKIEGLISLIGYGILSIAIFSISLWIMRELDINDIRYFLEVTNPRKMQKYISDEVRGKLIKP